MDEFQRFIILFLIINVSYLVKYITNKRWPITYILIKMYIKNGIIRKYILCTYKYFLYTYMCICTKKQVLYNNYIKIIVSCDS